MHPHAPPCTRAPHPLQTAAARNTGAALLTAAPLRPRRRRHVVVQSYKYVGMAHVQGTEMLAPSALGLHPEAIAVPLSVQTALGTGVAPLGSMTAVKAGRGYLYQCHGPVPIMTVDTQVTEGGE